MAIENSESQITRKRSSPGAFSVAICILLMFFAAVGFVSLRYRQHVLAAREWNSRRVALWHTFASLQGAAQAHNENVYQIQLTTAREQLDTLSATSQRMNQKNAIARQQFLARSRECLAPEVVDFLSRTGITACEKLLRIETHY